MARNLVQITPFLAVGPLPRAIAFYREVLGFDVHVEGGGYAYLEREQSGLRLLSLDADAPHPPGRGHIYVDTRDVEALFAEVRPALAALPAGRWGPPGDQPYGQREFWVRDPDGNLVTIGEGIGHNAHQWDCRDRR